jgi:hypothetical protein
MTVQFTLNDNPFFFRMTIKSSPDDDSIQFRWQLGPMQMMCSFVPDDNPCSFQMTIQCRWQFNSIQMAIEFDSILMKFNSVQFSSGDGSVQVA